ncbi:MAG: Na/Pi cotransporter family protein [Clostridia bacterium]|nr:Na/Pi cotransporter family protein [Clostridia bacterium]
MADVLGFDLLGLIGGLCLFLFGMNLMGEALEKRAGDQLTALIGRLTDNRFMGFLTGLGVTAIIQSSSATTVMVVGFVNSGVMTLKQSIGVIMGANIGTTVTAWILSLGGIGEGAGVILQLFKPSTFTPILALVGIILYMFTKSSKKQATGMIFLGFATLMFGMDAMSASVEALRDNEAFCSILTMFSEPILGVLAGAILTAIIQSSSASVGILQALASSTGAVTIGAALPIIMGQNIGTCITAVLSSFGANRNAKRVAVVHLSFNVIGTTILLTVLYIVRATLAPPILNVSADYVSISVSHTLFNVIVTAILFPCAGLLEKIARKVVPDAKIQEVETELDERLLGTPSIALENCYNYTEKMAQCAVDSLKASIDTIGNYSDTKAEELMEAEGKVDHFEDVIGNYLVKLSSHNLDDSDSTRVARLLKVIGDLERISDHSINILKSAEEIRDKDIKFSVSAQGEIKVLGDAVNEILDLTLKAFTEDNLEAAALVEPLEQAIDKLKSEMHLRHIYRLQNGRCSIETGFVLSDLLTNLERVSDHCSNIAGCIIETSHNTMNLHEGMKALKSEDPTFKEKYKAYLAKYTLPEMQRS